jgi:hypothetical protein
MEVALAGGFEPPPPDTRIEERERLHQRVGVGESLVERELVQVGPAGVVCILTRKLAVAGRQHRANFCSDDADGIRPLRRLPEARVQKFATT